MCSKHYFFRIAIVFCNLFLVSNAFCKNNEVKIANKPGWVIENKLDISSLTESQANSGGYYYLLIDNQENIGSETSYHHYIIKLLNNEGVQNMSDIDIDFDPSYQKLVFHEINLYRNGKKINLLLKHNIKTIQREADMERFLYDGSLTAIVNLKDIREGDIIEYSYSKQGFNPIYKGNYFGNFYFGFSIPTREIYTRIIAPNDKLLYFKYPAGKPDFTILKRNNNIEYICQKKETKALIYDNNVPVWYNKYQRVEVSTFANWKDVVKLNLENFIVSDTELNHLKQKTNGLFVSQNADSLLICIIRFVQDKIRYLAFESGMNSYKPILPCKVIDSRYGDCKAKSLLLCSILKLYKIEACPVLVNSNQIKFDTLGLPSMNLFNHCVVQINYKGDVYNIDPTISNQGGEINNCYFPNYGYGLVLKTSTIKLEQLANLDSSKTWIQHYYKVDKVGGPVSYKVVSQYSGYNADWQRSYFLNNSIDEIGKNYLKYYSKELPSIRSIAPITYTDDRIHNIFNVEKEYVIDSLWMPSKEKKEKLYLTVTAVNTNNLIDVPTSPRRTMPYSVSYPVHCLEDIYIDLPFTMTVPPEKLEIDDSVFHYTYTKSYSNRQIHLQHEYRTFSDYISPNAFNSYLSKHKEIFKHISYSITYNTNALKSFQFSWVIGLFFIVVVAIAIYFAVKIYKNFNLPNLAIDSRDIGGWLILVALGLLIYTIRISYQFFSDTRFFDQKTWQVLMQSSLESKIPLFIMMIVELIYNSTILVYLVLLQILFYRRRNILPRLIQIFYIVIVLFPLIDTVIVYDILSSSHSIEEKNNAYIEVYRSIVFSLIWTIYFIRSRRVKETFTKVRESSNESILASNPTL